MIKKGKEMQSCHSYLTVLTECDKEIVCAVIRETAGRRQKKVCKRII